MKTYKTISAFHLSRYKLPKGNSPKFGLGQGIVIVFPGELRHLTKELEDHWTNEASEEKGQIKKENEPRKIVLLIYHTSNSIKFHKSSTIFVFALLYRYIMQMVFL